jgi:L-lysine exporter family protein LysE/ArgO
MIEATQTVQAFASYQALATYASGFGLGASLIVAIGAQNAYVLKQGLMRQHVLLIVSICAVIDMTLIALGVGGMGVLIQHSPLLLTAVRWFGAAFLFLYGLRALVAAWRGAGHLDASAAEGASVRKTVMTVLALSLLNPHVYLDTVVLLGAIGARNGWPGDVYFALGAMSASVVWFFTLGFGARLLRPVFERDISWRILDGVIGIVMWSIAASLLL